jgi:hypothetical protein
MSAPKKVDAAERELAELELLHLERYLASKWPDLFLSLVADCRDHQWWVEEQGDEYVVNRAQRLADVAIERLRAYKLAELRRAGVKP